MNSDLQLNHDLWDEGSNAAKHEAAEIELKVTEPTPDKKKEEYETPARQDAGTQEDFSPIRDTIDFIAFKLNLPRVEEAKSEDTNN